MKRHDLTIALRRALRGAARGAGMARVGIAPLSGGED